MSLSGGLSAGLVGGLNRLGGSVRFTPLAARLAALLGPTASFYLPGPQWWFTDSGKTTPVTDTGLIQVWADASGNGRDLTQATTANRPQARLIGGRWRAVFDGVDDSIAASVSLTVRYAAAVHQWGGGGSTFPSFNTLLASVAGPPYFFRGASTNASWRSLGTPDGVFASDVAVNGVTTLNLSPFAAWHLSDGADATGAASTPLVGNDVASLGRFWNGSAAAIVVSTVAPDAATRAAVRTLLAEVTP